MSTTTVPKTFDAWRFHTRAPPRQSLKFDKGVPLRELKDGEVLLKPAAASINPVDWKVILLIPSFAQPFPITVGSDVAGVVISSKHPKWKEGDKVFGQVRPHKSPRDPTGAAATYTIVSGDSMVRVPEQYIGKWTDVVGIPLVGLTALTLALRVKEGDRVLVVGGSTSVALMLFQMLKSKQKASFVASVANAQKAEEYAKAGVDKVVDYKTQNPIDQLKKDFAVGSGNEFDVILDCVGNFDVFKHSATYLSPKGQVVTVGASDITPGHSLFELVRSKIVPFIQTILPAALGGIGRSNSNILLDGSVKNYETLQEWLADGTLKPITDKVYPFEQTVEAFDQLTGNSKNFGKILINIQEVA